MLDPNLDTTCTGGVVPQGGVDICVIRAGSIDIATDTVLNIVGTADAHGRVVAFVADNDLSIDGTISVSAHKYLNGPGGGRFRLGATQTSYNRTSSSAVAAQGQQQTAALARLAPPPRVVQMVQLRMAGLRR